MVTDDVCKGHILKTSQPEDGCQMFQRLDFCTDTLSEVAHSTRDLNIRTLFIPDVFRRFVVVPAGAVEKIPPEECYILLVVHVVENMEEDYCWFTE